MPNKAHHTSHIDNLVRLLYSTLELKRNCEHYSSLAENDGNHNLALFLKQVEQEESTVANQLREKLQDLTGWQPQIK